MHAVDDDPDAYRAAFDGPEEPTIGVEEEIFLIDRVSGVPRWEAPALCETLADPRFKPELPAAQLEYVSPPFPDLGAAADGLREARRDLVARAGPAIGFACAGTHPTAPIVASAPDDPRYQATFADHPWAADQQMVGALQVHVAIRPADIALAVTDALRSYLPDLTALAAAAPFRDGADTGLASVRPLIGTLLPRQGIPPVTGTWESYAATRCWLRAAGVAEERRIWWEVRLRPDFGTVEVRAMDAQPTAAGATALVALVAALAVWLADRARDGESLAVHPTERIAENRWRALHGGRRALLADLDTGALEPIEARVGRLLDKVAPTAARLGGGDLLSGIDALLRHNGADALRAAARERGIPGVATWLAGVFAEDAVTALGQPLPRSRDQFGYSP